MHRTWTSVWNRRCGKLQPSHGCRQKRKSSLFCRKRHHNASYRWHPSFCHNRIIFESSAGRIWFPCRCTPACAAIRPCDGDRFSFFNSYDRKRTLNPCRRQPKDGDVCKHFRRHHQHCIGCRVCSWIPLGHVWCCSGNRDRPDHLRDHCGLLSVTLPHSNPALRAFPAECFPSGTDLLTWHGFCHQPGCHDDRADYDEQPAKALRCTVRLRRVNSDCLFRNCHESQPALLFRDYRPVTGQPADPEF